MICEFRTELDETIVSWKIAQCPSIGESVLIADGPYTHVPQTEYVGTELIVEKVVHFLDHMGSTIDQSAIVYVKLSDN